MDFPYIKQEKDWYCGQACIQMVLEYLKVDVLQGSGVDVSGMTSDEEINLAKQDQISKREGFPVNHSDGIKDILAQWNGMITSPQKAVAMLQAFLTAYGEEKHWILYFDKMNDPNTGPDARQRFQTSLEHWIKQHSEEVPPPLVPIHGGSHWVVLHQYRERELENGDILREYLGHDPTYHYKKPSLKTITNYSYAGIIHINCDEPKYFDAPEHFLLIAKTDMDVSGKKELEPRLPPPAVESPKAPPSVEAIQKGALEALNVFGFRKPGIASQHLRGTLPSTPLLVSRLGQKDRKTPGDLDYYLISLQDKDQGNCLLVRMDARSGRYLDSLGIPPTQYLLGRSAVTKPRSELMNIVISQFPKNSRAVWAKALEDELIKTNALGQNVPRLVWKPCFQSVSAFYPFYEVKSGRDKFYVRIDGAYFPRLTTVANK